MATRKRGQRPAQHPAAHILHSPLGQFDWRGDPRTRDQRARAHNVQYGTAKAVDRRMGEIEHQIANGTGPADEGMPTDDSATGMQGSRRRLRAADPWARSQPVIFRDLPGGSVTGGGGRG